MNLSRVLPLVLVAALVAEAASAAACMNRFRVQSSGSDQTVTLLSGALTFQEAQSLAMAIRRNTAPGLEWVDGTGKVVAKQSGDLKVIRPMPVGCGSKSSGVVMSVLFQNANPPKGKMNVRFEAKSIVEFSEQAD